MGSRPLGNGATYTHTGESEYERYVNEWAGTSTAAYTRTHACIYVYLFKTYYISRIMCSNLMFCIKLADYR